MNKWPASGKIYLVCPAQTATGGPENLHQLGNKLRKLGIDAYMFYLPLSRKNPVHPNYRHYKVPFVKSVEQRPDHLVIFPEIWPGLALKSEYKGLRKAIWWLSVDNYFKYFNQPKKTIFSAINAWLRRRPVIPNMPSMEVLQQHPEILHLAQSAYALDFLKQQGFAQTAYLSDYLNPVFIANSVKVDLSQKKNQVVYNPKKGFEFTQQLIAAAPEINWIALQNLSPKEVAGKLAESKVYIDFGQHPGKDRFPREAAVMGCCIITGKQGSAGFEEDVPLPQGFKFEGTEEEIPAIIQQIKHCFSDFLQQQSAFAPYIQQIKSEERKMEEDIRKVFQ